jgi:hypothetical protein
MDCSKCHHDVIRIWSSRMMCCRQLKSFRFLCFVVINDHERDGCGDSEAGQGQAAALCSLAKRTLDAAESRYAQSWLLGRHLAPTAMMTGGAFRTGPGLTPSTCVNIETSKTLALLISPCRRDMARKLAWCASSFGRASSIFLMARIRPSDPPVWWPRRSIPLPIAPRLSGAC